MNGFKATIYTYLFRILNDWAIDVKHEVSNLRCEAKSIDLYLCQKISIVISKEDTIKLQTK